MISLTEYSKKLFGKFEPTVTHIALLLVDLVLLSMFFANFTQILLFLQFLVAIPIVIDILKLILYCAKS